MRTVRITLLGLALVLTAPATAVATTPVPGPVQQRTVAWRDCPTEAAPTKQCAMVSVPRRYDRPNGPRIQVALARIPATGKASQRIGSLLWDAGGPGGVSTELVDLFVHRMSADVRARFDFVAMDPRGVGASRPALGDCTSAWPVRPALDPFPNWGTVRERSAKELARANRQCLRTNTQIAQVMGTDNVVRDLDVIRAALGDQKLSFWATSYGTRIGYVYALRYPQRVRAMVMDGSIDPTAGYVSLPRIGGTSLDAALRSVRAHDRPAYRAAIRTAAALTADPIDLGEGPRFSRWDWLDIVGDLVPFQDSWRQLPEFAELVDMARQPGADGDKARELLAGLRVRSNSNEGGVFSVVNCLDYADRPSVATQVDIIAENAQRAPVFGGSLTTTFAIGCVGLQDLRPDPIPLVTTAAQRATLARVPVLLANATHDGATAFEWARRMQRVFDRPMIRYRSGQHVIWGATDSRCVNRPIDRFVLELRMPTKSRTCDFVPSPVG